MRKVCVSVLHYNDDELTSACIDSVLKLELPPNAELRIAVVDNASSNDSLLNLVSRYARVSAVNIIPLKSNVGFARGNNKAYDFFSKYDDIAFAVFLNNDIEILQNDFLVRVDEELKRSGVDVLTPDVYVPHLDWHQSPLCDGDEIVEYANSIAARSKKTLEACAHPGVLKVAKLTLKQLLSLNLLGRDFLRRAQARSAIDANWSKSRDNVVPQGACIIISPHFFKVMDFAFHPGTFMYFEECLLKVLCDKRGLRTRYSKDIVVLHHHNRQKVIPKPKKQLEQLASRAAVTLDSYQVFQAVLLDDL